MSPALTLPLPPHNFPRMLPHAMTGPQLPSHSACLRRVSIVSTFDLMVPLLRPSCSSAILLRHPRLPLPMTPSVPIAGGSRPPLYTARWLPAVETSAPRGGKRLSVRTERLVHPDPCIPPRGSRIPPHAAGPFIRPAGRRSVPLIPLPDGASINPHRRRLSIFRIP